MGSAPYALCVDGDGDQFAVTGREPRLSWKISPGTGSLSAYELEAAVDGVLQPPVVEESPQHLYIPWPWPALTSGQRVAWRVRISTPHGHSDWSDWARFEAGLLAEDWRARWISPVEGEDPGYGQRPAYVLSGAFQTQGVIESARLYVTALGVYEVFVNAERSGTTQLAPGSTSYDRTLYAQAFDVTDAVMPGTNHITMVLADGWYRGQVGAFRIPAAWGSTLGGRVELHVRYADGSVEAVLSDADWTSSAANITRADLMDGESIDFTKTGAEETYVYVDKVVAPVVEWSPAPPVRIIESRSPRNITRIDEETIVVDFGQNASGWISLSELGPAGTRTTIDYGEHVGSDGDLTTTHLDSTRPGDDPIEFVQRDQVISAGHADVFEPHHTVHGFQYARIWQSGENSVSTDEVTMRIVHTDLTRTGEFECGNPALNRFHAIADWSFRGNAVDVPTDCPTRERLGWTGDYQIFVSTATRLYDVLGFSRKWLRSVRDDQLDDGRVANFSPDGRRVKHHLDDQLAMMTGSAGWGDAITIVPWELYQEYGDRRILEENWQAMVRWVDWALDTASNVRHPSRVQRSEQPLPHERYIWDGSFHWGEWTEPKVKDANGVRIDPIQDNPMAWFTADKGEVGTAYLYRSTLILAQAAAVLGRSEDSARYAETAERVLDAWRIEFLHADGITVTDSQASYVRALSLGLVPHTLQEAAATRLVRLIRDAGMHLSTGFLSTGDLLPTLADFGHADVAYELLLQRTPPSWLYMLDHGATTIWEDWEGIDVHGIAHDSLNHYSKGAAIRYLHTHTLGLRRAPGSVAWDSFLVEPVPHTDVTWARGTHETPQGTIGVDWRVDQGTIRITVMVPPGTVATVCFPDGDEYRAEEGTFTRTKAFVSDVD